MDKEVGSVCDEALVSLGVRWAKRTKNWRWTGKCLNQIQYENATEFSTPAIIYQGLLLFIFMETSYSHLIRNLSQLIVSSFLTVFDWFLHM